MPLPKNKTVECLTDKDCGVGGCSGEVCTTLEKSKEIVTICIWLPEFECLRLTSCRCTEGKCGWEETQAYRECMREVRYSCNMDSDCVCGGIDMLTGECFIGNVEYYKKYVNKTKICPDFCAGIMGNLETRCIENKCKLVTKK